MPVIPREIKIDTLLSLVSTPMIALEIPSLKIISFNEEACDLSGYPQSQVQRLSLTHLFSKKTMNLIEALTEMELIGPVKFTDQETSLSRKSGRKCPVHIFARRLKLDDKNVLVLNVVDQSDERRRAAERKKLIEESARVSKLADLGQLAAGMAHELNNPLAIITGYIEEIETDLRSDNPNLETIRENFEPLKRACERMGKVVSGMLSKVRNDPQKLLPISLDQSVMEVLSFYNQIFKSQNIEVELHIEHLLRNPVKCDPLQIDQILTNIVSNACNALENVKKPKIKIYSDLSDDSVSLSVHNNGEPIPPEIQKKLFTPFFTTKAVGEGTGLGLYMSYQFMKGHNGNLICKSHPDRGTSFTLVFPRQKLSKSELHQISIPKALVIDDESHFRKLITKRLERSGFDTKSSRSISEAKASLDKEGPFDILFVDYNLNGEKGTDLEEKTFPVDSIPFVVLMSGNSNTALLASLRDQYKFDAFLCKPFTELELQDVLRKAQCKALEMLRKVG